jgi:hypothetical protein
MKTIGSNMKAHKALLLVLILPLLVSGCANMSRTATVEVNRNEVVSPQSNVLMPALAGDLFRDVAKQLGFVVDPVQAGQGSMLYTAHAPKTNSTNQPYLTLWIDDKQVNFISNIYGTLQDFAAATNAANLFQQELGKRGIQYNFFSGKRLYQDSIF